MVRVKICGITSVRDAQMAVDCGADAIGLVFAKSVRRVDGVTAKKIAQAVGPWTTVVGVFADQRVNEILKIVRECPLSVVQLHGDEDVRMLRRLNPLRIIKTIRVGGALDLKMVHRFQTKADALLFDTKAAGQYGGTGCSFDWTLLASLKFNQPIMVSGGLTPANVAKAVRQLKPYGVEASSGVERRPGVKDLQLVKEFIRRAKAA